MSARANTASDPRNRVPCLDYGRLASPRRTWGAWVFATVGLFPMLIGARCLLLLLQHGGDAREIVIGAAIGLLATAGGLLMIAGPFIWPDRRRQ